MAKLRWLSKLNPITLAQSTGRMVRDLDHRLVVGPRARDIKAYRKSPAHRLAITQAPATPRDVKVGLKLRPHMQLVDSLRAKLRDIEAAIAPKLDTSLHDYLRAHKLVANIPSKSLDEFTNALNSLESFLGRKLTFGDLGGIRSRLIDVYDSRNPEFIKLVDAVKDKFNVLGYNKNSLKHLSELANKLNRQLTTEESILKHFSKYTKPDRISSSMFKAYKPFAENFADFRQARRAARGALDNYIIHPLGALLSGGAGFGIGELLSGSKDSDTASTTGTEGTEGTEPEAGASDSTTAGTASATARGASTPSSDRSYKMTLAGGVGGGLVSALVANKLADKHFKKHKTLATIGGGLLGALAGGAAGNYLDTMEG